MKPPRMHKAAVWLSLALLAIGASAAERPGDAGRPRTLATGSPFLDAFLSHHKVTVVTQPVHWVSAIGRHQGLLARDDSNERLPALLLIDAAPAGSFAKRSALELAEIGYVVLLVEVDQRHAADAGQGQGHDAAQRERVLAQLSAAVRWLRRRDDVFPDRVGVLGWNGSARWALEAAAAGGLQAAVLGEPPLPLALDAELATGLRQTAVLIVRGAAGTTLLDGEHLARLQRQLETAGITHRVLAFDGAKAGFMQRGLQDPADAPRADRAWFEVYEYLGKHVEDVGLKELLAARDGSAGDGGRLHQVASIADLMRVVNTPSGVRGELAHSLTDEPPSEKDWQQARARAALMADAGALLAGLKPPKGNAATWQRHVASYRDAAAAIAAAADQRDYSAALQALERLNRSCAKCHLDHR